MTQKSTTQFLLDENQFPLIFVPETAQKQKKFAVSQVSSADSILRIFDHSESFLRVTKRIKWYWFFQKSFRYFYIGSSIEWAIEPMSSSKFKVQRVKCFICFKYFNIMYSACVIYTYRKNFLGVSINCQRNAGRLNKIFLEKCIFGIV